MANAHRRKFDAVLVWKIDLFGRSLKRLVNALANLCAYGVAFVSFRDNFDLSDPEEPAKAQEAIQALSIADIDPS